MSARTAWLLAGASAPARVGSLEAGSWVTRHTNQLLDGHLRGRRDSLRWIDAASASHGAPDGLFTPERLSPR